MRDTIRPHLQVGRVCIHLCFQVYEGRVRSISLEGISSLQEINLRLNTWRNRMEMMDDISLQVNLSCTFHRKTPGDPSSPPWMLGGCWMDGSPVGPQSLQTCAVSRKFKRCGRRCRRS